MTTRNGKQNGDFTLNEFLVDLFERLLPRRVSVFAVSGRGGSKFGAEITQYEFPNQEKPNPGALTALAWGIERRAQQDCRALGYAQKYAVVAFAFSSDSAPHSRYVLSMKPRT